jgi:hypothetical protein
MTSYLVLYMTQGAKLFGQGDNARASRLSPFGLLPHEIAALNARRSADVCPARPVLDDATAGAGSDKVGPPSSRATGELVGAKA